MTFYPPYAMDDPHEYDLDNGVVRCNYKVKGYVWRSNSYAVLPDEARQIGEEVIVVYGDVNFTQVAQIRIKEMRDVEPG